MATTSEIAEVRQNVDEPTDQSFTDNYISDLVDEHGINGTSAIIWRKKAGDLAKLVNVSEAGASHSFSDLHRNALAMAKVYEDKDSQVESSDRARVKTIARD
jgi:hypothetical protein